MRGWERWRARAEWAVNRSARGGAAQPIGWAMPAGGSTMRPRWWGERTGPARERRLRCRAELCACVGAPGALQREAAGSPTRKQMRKRRHTSPRGAAPPPPLCAASSDRHLRRPPSSRLRICDAVMAGKSMTWSVGESGHPIAGICPRCRSSPLEAAWVDRALTRWHVARAGRWQARAFPATAGGVHPRVFGLFGPPAGMRMPALACAPCKGCCCF